MSAKANAMISGERVARLDRAHVHLLKPDYATVTLSRRVVATHQCALRDLDE